MTGPDNPVARIASMLHDAGIAAMLTGSFDVVSAEDLVIAKLEWAQTGESERQLQDVAAIVAVRGDELDREYIERWVTRLGVDGQWHAVLKRVSAES